MTADGVLSPMTPGIYTFGPTSGWLSRAWAGILLGGEGATLGLESAARLLGLRASARVPSINCALRGSGTSPRPFASATNSSTNT